MEKCFICCRKDGKSLPEAAQHISCSTWAVYCLCCNNGSGLLGNFTLSHNLRNFFFIGYFLYLHFKCYPLSWFPLQKSAIPFPLPLLSNTPTPTSWPWHSPTLGYKARAYTGPRAFPPIDEQQGHPLLHIQLEPRVPTRCTLWLVV